MNVRNTPEKHIVIDALGVNEVGGARSATIPLLKRVFHIKQDWHFTCFLTKYEAELDFKNVNQIILPLSKGFFSRIVFQFIIFFFTMFNKVDLTHFIKSQGNIIFFSKKVITIYDCTILKYPSYFNVLSRLFWRYLQPLICRTMDSIVTISDNAKSEISTCLNVPNEKISVIYPAPQFPPNFITDKMLEEKIKEKYALKDNYLLYIGQIGMKKNLNTLIKAYRILKEKYSISDPLIMVGPRYYLSDAGEIFDIIENSNLNEEIHYLGAINNDELYVILKNSLLLLFPSVHEGFGIPIVEAMQLGIPVIASNTSVMPEVLREAGVLVDDFLSPEAWAEEIFFLYNNSKQRELLSEKCKIRSKNFSWEESANQLINIYSELL